MLAAAQPIRPLMYPYWPPFATNAGGAKHSPAILAGVISEPGWLG
jgi:hypothetical protein